MTSILVYCRAGYEADTANEITTRATELECFGYPTFEPKAGYIQYQCYTPEHADLLGRKLAVDSLIFARQIVVVTHQLENIDKADRIGPILGALADQPSPSGLFGDVSVDYADTDDGKVLAKFCRKFVVPLRQALRKKGALTNKEQPDRAQLHVFFTAFDACLLGYSYAACRSPFPLGICRLKFPPTAPSRSTLKLDEAIVTMLTDEQQRLVFRSGGSAVDLGACPGGWTYQLVHRGLHVEAIDNGLIDDALMATGQVQHFAADGFTYKPQNSRVDLLVCDMIEQPDRVAKLMGDWLVNQWADHAIFNLKLPMKRRYETVVNAMASLHQRLNKLKSTFSVRVRHLYHDRDEVTVTVVRNLKN